MTRCALYVSNDNVIELFGLRDASAPAGDFLNSASVQYTLYDAAGAIVAGPTNMLYLANSDGCYQGLVANTVVLIAGARYRAQIDADAGADKFGRWEFDIPAEIRAAECPA